MVKGKKGERPEGVKDTKYPNWCPGTKSQKEEELRAEDPDSNSVPGKRRLRREGGKKKTRRFETAKAS